MFNINDKNKSNYSILKQYFISEQNLEVIELCHNKTAAKLVLFICDDENRVFNIAFKTPVSDSKGTPHILEHSVLCGSKKYDVKDPFIELLKSSMKTFLNAMTFPDKTCYPVASANLKDFHNLVDVYMDAVFYPNAISNDKIFKQEGWHYEIDNRDSDLKVNGVVFNEMRGVYSNPDSILESSILSNLFKHTNYEFESGGDPKEIYNLTFDEFKLFHKKFYSPTNSIIYLYGNLDYNYELEYFDSEYLCKFDYIDVKAEFADAEASVYSSEQIDYYNIDSEDNKDNAYLAYTFGIEGEKTSLKNLVIQIIDYVLFSSDSAILKEKFLNEGYGESVFSRYDMGLKQGFYSIISQNVLESKKDNFIKLFDDYINEIVNNGIDVDKFSAGINSLYFAYAEGEFSTFPRGLYLTLVSLETYLYDQGITTLLEYKDSFEIIRKEDLSSKDNIFIKVLKEIFIENKHRAINVLRPKMGYSKEKDDFIKDELRVRKNSLKEMDIDNIILQAKELKEYQKQQDSSENLKCIPMLKIGDIDRDKKTINYEVEINDNIDTIITYKNDKDIVYIGLKFDITDLKKEEICLFSVISNVIGKVDLVTESYHEFNNFVDINTGGLRVAIEITDRKAFLSFGIKVASDKVKYAFDIFYKLFSETQFVDSKRINILLNESKQNSLLSILSSGHIAAMNRAKSNIDFKSDITDKVDMNGIGYFKFISLLCNNYQNNSDLVNDSLDLLFKKIHRRKMYLTLCTNRKYHDDIINNFKHFTDRIIKNKMKHIYTEHDESRLNHNINDMDKFIHFESLDKKCRYEAILTPSDINFCALAGKYNKELYSGSLSVLKTLFNYEYLWTNIRVLGGAYGCMSMFSKEGYYSFCSYRDPNLSSTNKIYLGIPEFLKSFDKSDEEIRKYIIGSIGVFDNPLSTVDNHNRNIAAYFNGISDEEYNTRRHEVLDTTLDDIRKLSEIFNDVANGERCALISAAKLEEAKEEYDSVWQLIE